MSDALQKFLENVNYIFKVYDPTVLPVSKEQYEKFKTFIIQEAKLLNIKSQTEGIIEAQKIILGDK